MSSSFFKATRVEARLPQKDLSETLGITEKAMNHKELIATNKFTADEMLTLSWALISPCQRMTLFLTQPYRLFKSMVKNLSVPRR